MKRTPRLYKLARAPARADDIEEGHVRPHPGIRHCVVPPVAIRVFAMAGTRPMHQAGAGKQGVSDALKVVGCARQLDAGLA